MTVGKVLVVELTGAETDSEAGRRSVPVERRVGGY